MKIKKGEVIESDSDGVTGHGGKGKFPAVSGHSYFCHRRIKTTTTDSNLGSSDSNGSGNGNGYDDIPSNLKFSSRLTRAVKHGHSNSNFNNSQQTKRKHGSLKEQMQQSKHQHKIR